MEEVNVKIYIAGASSEIERARSAIAWAGAQGLQVTRDWTGPASTLRGLQGSIHEEQRRHLAELDVDAVQQASLFWLLVPSEGHSTAGAWVEFGVALAHEHCFATIASGGVDPSLFTSLATARVATDEEAKAKIMHWTKYLGSTPKPDWPGHEPPKG